MALIKKTKFFLITLGLALTIGAAIIGWQKFGPKQEQAQISDTDKVKAIIESHEKEIKNCNSILNEAFEFYIKAKTLSETPGASDNAEIKIEIAGHITSAKEKISESDKCMSGLMTAMMKEVLEKQADYQVFQTEWKEYYAKMIPDEMKPQ